ncbi:MAG: ABC transporter substrate-binding protein [Anaerolineae bacterium]
MRGSKSFSRRSVLSALGVGAAGAAMAACGATPTPQVIEKEVTTIVEGTPQVVTETVVVTQEVEKVVEQTVVVQVTPAGLEPAELAVWVWWPGPVASLNQMSAFFMGANPNVKVTVEAPTDYWTKLQTSLAGNAGPDIYFMNNVNYWSWATKGVLVDLDEMVAKDANMQDNLANSWEAAVDFYKFDGKYYGLPFMYTTVVLYYNEDYIKAEGLQTPAEVGDDFDWTMMREYANQLTKRDGDAYTMYGFQSSGIETGWLNFVRGNGGDFLNADATKCIIDETASVDTWQYLVDMQLKDLVAPSANATQAESPTSMFMTGKIAMLTDGDWTMKTYNEQLTDFAYNVAKLPKSPTTGNRGGTSNIVGLVMNKSSKFMNQSWSLMTHLLNKYSQDVFANADVLAPVRNDSAELYFANTKGPANRMAAFEMKEFTTALPTHRVVTWGEMMKPTGEWQTEIFEGRVDVQEGLTSMATDVNDLFAKAG